MKGLTIKTELGYVDLVAVERVLSGHRCPLTQAETAYLLRYLADDITASPPQGKYGQTHGEAHPDARFVMAADGLGVRPDRLADRVYKIRKPRRHARPS
jgi:hypothetical protein